VTTIASPDQQLLRTVREIAVDVAAPNADSVDREARFPAETIGALRESGALAALVPERLGGTGADLPTIAACCLELGRACGASAMVFAMHQIQLASIVRHLEPNSWFETYVGGLIEAPRLIASVTSEVGTGGDMSRSVAAVTVDDDGRCSFQKNAPTVSYGQYADDLLTTLRRSPGAEAGDQVAVLTHREQSHIETTGTWDVLGMRGTCSPGGLVSATFPAEQVMSAPFSEIGTESMVPISHILWSHLWLGIAEDAFARARAFARAAARRAPDDPPYPAQRLSRVMTELSVLRAEVQSGLATFQQATETPNREGLRTMAATLRFNTLKITASEHASDVCRGALDVSGIVGFKNDTPFSIGRHLRDSMSGPLMIANERIHQTNANLLLITKDT
jgi:acyl-CoA dehydrogenase